MIESGNNMKSTPMTNTMICDWREVEVDGRYGDTKWVEIRVRVQQNATGKIREFNQQAVFDTDESMPSLYIWKHGNYACDCNRELMFNRFKEPDVPKAEPEPTCSYGRYSVQLLNPMTGEIFYDDFETKGDV